MSLTPHGEGFSFLDSFELTIPGQEGHGRKWLDPKLPFFADHFPERPLMPGVLLLECGAQAAGALWASTLAPEATRVFVLAQVIQFKIQHPVFPGDTLETAVVLQKDFGALASFDLTLTVQDKEVARGQIVMGRPEQPSAPN